MLKLASVYNDERVNAKGVLHSLSTNEFIEEYQQYNNIWRYKIMHHVPRAYLLRSGKNTIAIVIVLISTLCLEL